MSEVIGKKNGVRFVVGVWLVELAIVALAALVVMGVL